MQIVRLGILKSLDGRQFCTGMIGGCEAAVHRITKIYEENEASLIVDAPNAFNSLNRASTLINLQNICPALAPGLINTYRNPGSIFIDGETILSNEGTTQRDPLGMAMYTIGIQQLVKHLDNIDHINWYADNYAAGGNLRGRSLILVD